MQNYYIANVKKRWRINLVQLVIVIYNIKNMGFNISGLIIKNKSKNLKELESLLNNKLKFVEDIDFEQAMSNYRVKNTIDIMQSPSGIFAFMEVGQFQDLTRIKSDCIQFLISDVSDTYFFEKYSNGKLDRKLITSQGEISEEYGEGYIKKGDDFMDKIWKFAEEYLEDNFTEDMFSCDFKRYKIKEKGWIDYIIK